MRHQVAGRKLGRTSAHRSALMRNLAVALIQHGRIRTTLHKAKELRGFADNLVTLGKKDSLHARRLAFNRLRDRGAVTKLFQDIAPAFQKRNGGYTRIYHLGPSRPGDTAKMALIEYLSEDLLKKTAENLKNKKAKKSETKTDDAELAKAESAESSKKSAKAKSEKTESSAKKSSVKKPKAKKSDAS